MIAAMLLACSEDPTADPVAADVPPQPAADDRPERDVGLSIRPEMTFHGVDAADVHANATGTAVKFTLEHMLCTVDDDGDMTSDVPSPDTEVLDSTGRDAVILGTPSGLRLLGEARDDLLNVDLGERAVRAVGLRDGFAAIGASCRLSFDGAPDGRELSCPDGVPEMVPDPDGDGVLVANGSLWRVGRDLALSPVAADKVAVAADRVAVDPLSGFVAVGTAAAEIRVHDAGGRLVWTRTLDTAPLDLDDGGELGLFAVLTGKAADTVVLLDAADGAELGRLALDTPADGLDLSDEGGLLVVTHGWIEAFRVRR